MAYKRTIDDHTYQEVASSSCGSLFECAVQLLIVVIIGAFTALVLFIVDRWRKTIQGVLSVYRVAQSVPCPAHDSWCAGKRKRRLERSLEMRTFSGKQVPDGMQQFVR